MVGCFVLVNVSFNFFFFFLTPMLHVNKINNEKEQICGRSLTVRLTELVSLLVFMKVYHDSKTWRLCVCFSTVAVKTPAENKCDGKFNDLSVQQVYEHQLHADNKSFLIFNFNFGHFSSSGMNPFGKRAQSTTMPSTSYHQTTSTKPQISKLFLSDR